MPNPESLQPDLSQSELSREVTAAESERIKKVTAQIEEILNPLGIADLQKITQEEYKKLDPSIRDQLTRLSEKLESLVSGEHQTVFENEILTPEVLEKQLNEQKEAYLAAGLLTKNDEGVVGFEVNGEFYPFPEAEEIDQYLTENKESEAFFQEQIKRGYTKILVSPFVLPLNQMISTINQKVTSEELKGRVCFFLRQLARS